MKKWVIVENRTLNIKRNLIFNLIKFVTQLVLQFVLRTVLIYTMGVEYLGLNGLFTNIFTFLNLAELGIGSAIVFSMYKPIADGDTEKVKALQQLYKKFYLVITLIVLSLGILVLPFIKYLIKGDVNANINIYILYSLYLLNSLVGYLCAHKRSLLFAYQRNDIENKIKTLCVLFMTILQIAVLLIFKNYYIFFIINIMFTIIESLLVYFSARNLYPEINGKSEPLDESTKKEISKNIAAISLHKIGNAVVFSTDNILISSMLGLAILGAYSNYYLIITSIISIFSLITNSLLGSVGNLIASADKEYAYQKFKQINFIFSILSSFTTICMLVLFQPFITLWTGGGVYLLEFLSVILLCVSFYLSRMRLSTLLFKDAAGLFKQDKWKPLCEALINLIASIVLALFWSINGIILGTILSTVLAPLWIEPKVLYKHYFKKSIWSYFKQYLIDALIMIAVGAICYFVCSFIPDGGIWLLIAKFATCVPLCGILLLIAYLPSKEFKQTLSTFKSFIKKSK